MNWICLTCGGPALWVTEHGERYCRQHSKGIRVYLGNTIFKPAPIAPPPHPHPEPTPPHLRGRAIPTSTMGGEVGVDEWDDELILPECQRR